MSYNIITDPGTSPVTDLEQWAAKYKDAFIEHNHDQSMMNLVTPDESIVVIGPPRLAGNDATAFHVVGMLNTLQYSEQAQVQPMKAIGSRRHVFSKTNAPVQGSIGRMMVLGGNLYRALYAVTNHSNITSPDGTKFSRNNAVADDWYTNLEEDLFRLPFGMGIIYMAPTTAAGGGSHAVGADYLEIVTLVNRSSSIQTGQAFVMEQVSFMADRVVPWGTHHSGQDFGSENPAGAILP